MIECVELETRATGAGGLKTGRRAEATRMEARAKAIRAKHAK